MGISFFLISNILRSQGILPLCTEDYSLSGQGDTIVNYSTVTDLARFLGLSTSRPLATLT